MSRPDPRQLIDVALRLINHLGVENATVGLASGPDGALRVRVEFRGVSLRAGRFEGIDVDEGLIHVEGIDPSKKDPKELLASVKVRVERLLIRVSSSLVNRLFESQFFQAELRRNAPVEVRDLRLNFSMDTVTLEGEVKKGIAFPFIVELYMEAVNNRLRIVFQNFWAAKMVPLPGFVRKMVMSVARSKVEGRKELQGLVTIDDDYVMINPWPKVPVAVEAEFTRFGVEGSYFVVEMGPPMSVRLASAAAAAPAAPAAPAVPAARPSPLPSPAPALSHPPIPPVPTPAPRPAPAPEESGSPSN